MLQSNTHQILFVFESLDLCLVVSLFYLSVLLLFLSVFVFFCCVHKTNLRIKFGLVFILFWLVPAFYFARFVFSFSFSFCYFEASNVSKNIDIVYTFNGCGENDHFHYRCVVADINRSTHLKSILCCCKWSLFWLWWWMQFKPLSIDHYSLP